MIRIALIFLVLASCSNSDPNAVDLKEGDWEVTSSMEMASATTTIPPVTSHQCITKKSLVPQKAGQRSGCKTIRNDVSGDTVSWKMECAKAGMKIKTEGEITYKGDTFEGSSKTKMGDITMKTKMTGKWVGPCK